MKRIRLIKNTVMIGLVIVFAGASFLTMNFIGGSSFGGVPPQNDFSMSQKPNMNNGNNSQNSDNNQQGQPPQSQNGNDSGNQQDAQPPQMQGNNDNNQQDAQPPQIQGNNDNNQQNAQPPQENGNAQGGENEGFVPDNNGSADNNNNGNSESDSRNNGKSDSDNQSGFKPDNNQNNQNGFVPDNNRGIKGGGFVRGGEGFTVIAIVKYGAIAADSLIIAALVIYLVLSGFNKKGLKATLGTTKRIVAFALCSLIAATALTGTQIALTHIFTNGITASSAMRGQPPQGGMSNKKLSSSSSSEVKSSGNTTVTDTKTLSKSYSSTKSDESAVLVENGGKATLDGAEVTKSGDSSSNENSDFYGLNSGVLVTKNSTATIKNTEINTSAKGGNAVFSTGENSKIYVKDTKITTTGESSSRGLDATYGGYIEADNVTVNTKGGSCAALATDRGEGTVKMKNSNLTTNGSGSPVIYSTGDISLSNSKGLANGSQIAVVEGKNSATITSSTLSASGAGNRNDVDQAGVMVYQSMSGDAGTGKGTFTAKDSSLSINKSSKYYTTAPMFFVTNTDAEINLTNTKLDFGSGTLLKAEGTSEWGNSGSNGGNVNLNAENQTLSGNITADKISTLKISLKNSSYKGAINSSETAKNVTLTLDKNSKITLTGDTYVTSLSDADSTYSNINLNGHKLYVNGKELKK